MTKAIILADQQLAHLAWHGDQLSHWHVGPTSLDGIDGRKTEHVTRFYDAPVYRSLEIGRDDVLAVPRSRSSCHPQPGPTWPERGTVIE